MRRETFHQWPDIYSRFRHELQLRTVLVFPQKVVNTLHFPTKMIPFGQICRRLQAAVLLWLCLDGYLLYATVGALQERASLTKGEKRPMENIEIFE